MNMKKIGLLIIISLIFFSCKKKANNEVVKQNENYIVNRDPIKEIIQKAIDVKKMDVYFSFLSNADKEEFVIVKNETLGVHSNLEIRKFNKKIKIIPYDSVKQKGIKNFICFLKIEYFTDSLFVSYNYNIENLDCEISFKKQNDNWNEELTRIGQY